MVAARVSWPKRVCINERFNSRIQAEHPDDLGSFNFSAGNNAVSFNKGTRVIVQQRNKQGSMSNLKQHINLTQYLLNRAPKYVNSCSYKSKSV